MTAPYRGATSLSKNVSHYDCLGKKKNQLKLSAMARNTFNIRRGRQCFLYKSGFLRYNLRLTSIFEFFNSLRESKFKCGFLIFLIMKLDVRITSCNFRVNKNFSNNILMQFLLKGNFIQIHVVYPFLTVQYRLF